MFLVRITYLILLIVKKKIQRQETEMKGFILYNHFINVYTHQVFTFFCKIYKPKKKITKDLMKFTNPYEDVLKETIKMKFIC